MATTIPGNLIPIPISPPALSQPVAAACAVRRRTASREAGKALEMLGHAVEYLADEFALECMSRQNTIAAGMHPRVRAIEILKACNRQVFLSCPEVPTLKERIHSLFSLRRR